MEYHHLPQPEEIPIREREDAMGAYLMMFASIGAGLPLPIINLIAAVVYYFVNKKKSRFVHFHSLQSLLSQLPTSLINAIAVFWGLRIIILEWEFSDTFQGYLWMALVANLIYFAFSIVAAIQARKGRMYYLLLFGRISYNVAYKVKAEAVNKAQNLPPS